VSRTAKVVVGALAAVVVLVGAAGAWYVFRDSAESEASLQAVTGPSAAPGNGSGRTSPDGNWKVAPGNGVFAGYRVNEVLFGQAKEATGRTGDVTGTMTVQGATIPAATVTANLKSLASDDTRRDRAIAASGLETARFPEASFKLTQPITLAAAPAAGAPVTATAQGELTLHGQTHPVSVPVTAQWDGDQIAVATQGKGVPVKFQDYGMEALSVPVAKTEDAGSFEFQLKFAPA
jgi:polyisoprenoid-binding protein YceI